MEVDAVVSRFGWLDTDDAQRRAMLSVVELFKDEGTVDEIGIGAVRDSVSDRLFPGTSVLLTRARYFLMIPWLVKQTVESTAAPSEAQARLRSLEGRLIHSLLRGGETDGVIGRTAKDKLKRMPSVAYWAALGRYELRNPELSIEGLLRTDITGRQVQQRQVTPDDPGAARDQARSSLHPDLPPAPAELLDQVTLELTAEESDFLIDRITTTTKGSLFAWLLTHQQPSDVDYAWEHPAGEAFPDEAQEYVDAGRRFHCLSHGAALTYNRVLAGLREDDELIAAYDDEIADWGEELAELDPFATDWSLGALWALMERHGKGVTFPTRDFLEKWVAGVRTDGAAAAHNPAMQQLLRQREISLKGGRARVANRDALNAWTGRAGLVRLDYRWGVTQRLVNDLLEPVEVI